MEALQVTNSGVVQYSPNDVLNQVKSIQELMSKAMHDGEHYGKIPGCGDKPTLLKAGAEKINLMFRLAPKYQITEKEFPNGHKEYRVVTELIHIPTGNNFGQGVGSASTLETKWRYRNQITKIADKLPDDYKENKNHYKEQGFIAKKEDNGSWGWYKKERIEHDNPADNYNTVLKMAKKRSLVDAALTSTAASDIFTQDVEELVENGVIGAEEKAEPIKEVEYVEVKSNGKSQLDLALEESKNHDWNGKVYKGGVVYVNNKKFVLTEDEISVFKSKIDPLNQEK